MIIAAYAGTGKTTLAKLHPDKFLDFPVMPYKYHLDTFADSEDAEKAKANPYLVMQEYWPENYVEAIKEIMYAGKIILIPSASNVLRHLDKENIPYILCYPQRSAKEIYRKRYIDRGNTEDFLNIFIDGWDYFLGILENNLHGTHIVMKPNQFLSDVVYM